MVNSRNCCCGVTGLGMLIGGGRGAGGGRAAIGGSGGRGLCGPRPWLGPPNELLGEPPNELLGRPPNEGRVGIGGRVGTGRCGLTDGKLADEPELEEENTVSS